MFEIITDFFFYDPAYIEDTKVLLKLQLISKFIIQDQSKNKIHFTYKSL
jgi:hypothetical protein